MLDHDVAALVRRWEADDEGAKHARDFLSVGVRLEHGWPIVKNVVVTQHGSGRVAPIKPPSGSASISRGTDVATAKWDWHEASPSPPPEKAKPSIHKNVDMVAQHLFSPAYAQREEIACHSSALLGPCIPAWKLKRHRGVAAPSCAASDDPT